MGFMSTTNSLPKYFVPSDLDASTLRTDLVGEGHNPVTNKNSSLEKVAIIPFRLKLIASGLSSLTSRNKIWWTNGLLKTRSISTNRPNTVLLNKSSCLEVSFSLTILFAVPMCDDMLEAWPGKRLLGEIFKPRVILVLHVKTSKIELKQKYILKA